MQQLNDALRYYNEALKLLPPDAVDDLAAAHDGLGSIFNNAGDIDRALSHYREAIRYDELGGNHYEAGTHRYNVAVTLAQDGRFADALDYANAALRNYETFGERAGDNIERTKGLIMKIEEKKKKAESGK